MFNEVLLFPALSDPIWKKMCGVVAVGVLLLCNALMKQELYEKRQFFPGLARPSQECAESGTALGFGIRWRDKFR
jgi:hypothetical protein